MLTFITRITEVKLEFWKNTKSTYGSFSLYIIIFRRERQNKVPVGATVGSVVLHVTGCLYEDEDEFKDSEADIVSSGVLVSARRMFASSLLDVLICSSKIYIMYDKLKKKRRYK